MRGCRAILGAPGERSGSPAGSEPRGRGWAGVPEESPLGSCDTEGKYVRGVPWNTSSPAVVHILPRSEPGDRALLSRATSLLLLYAMSWDVFLNSVAIGIMPGRWNF